MYKQVVLSLNVQVKAQRALI